MKKNNIELPKLLPETTLIDTHCHLDMDVYEKDLANIIESAKSYNIEHIITIGIDYESSLKAVDIANHFQNISATVGVHPHDAQKADKNVYKKLIELAENKKNKVVGYGEIGLDYVKNYSPRDVQMKHFSFQLSLAKELDLPVIIHDREAHEDTLKILRQHTPLTAGGVMHCFSGDTNLAHQVLDLGLHISIPGVITFKNAKSLQKVAKNIPIERLLLETDGPFLTPAPYRGKTNRPQYLLYTALKVAELLNISLDNLAKETTKNAKRLFRLQQNTYK